MLDTNPLRHARTEVDIAGGRGDWRIDRVAIGSGSDVAKETGGIILINDDVRDVVTGIRLSRATMRTIKQNLFWAFAYNSVGVPIAALGFLNPIIAAAAMALSSLSVVVNSALLKRARIAPQPQRGEEGPSA